MTVRVLQGHVLDRLRELPEESVHCVVSSPPYWGLRAYGTEPQVWGGVAECEHEWGDDIIDRSKLTPGVTGSSLTNSGAASMAANRFESRATFCASCGAWRGEHGLEPTVDLWVEHEVAIFGEVRRVLRPDGTLWLNIGDCYASHGGGREDGSSDGGTRRAFNSGQRPGGAGLKPKDRVGLPHRLAFALQADGWWWRDEIVWAKPNPMPSSIKDRTCCAHEFVMMFSKAAKYYYDNVAIMEPIAEASVKRYAQPTLAGQQGGFKQEVYEAGLTGQKARSRRPAEVIKDLAASGKTVRQRRSVWTVPTAPFKGAHFATFPPALVEPCVKAGTSEKGVCPKCGAPWRRETKTSYHNPSNRQTNGPRSLDRRHEAPGFETRLEKDVATIGWSPSCACDAGPPVPATVLDPFAGSGTVGLVADRLGRDTIMIELKPEYVDMARRRIAADAGMFAGTTG